MSEMSEAQEHHDVAAAIVAQNHERELPAVASSPMALMQVALHELQDGPQAVEVLERLMAMDREMRADRARTAYYEAMSRFQADAPELRKGGEVGYGTGQRRTAYRFATLPSIAGAIRKPLRDAGLSYRFEIAHGESGALRVTCIVTHVAGHSERTEMSAPPDTSGSKNPIQACGSSVKYLQRYTLLCALGLVTGDQDTDGQTPEPPITDAEAHAIADLASQVDDSRVRRMLEWAGCQSIREMPRRMYAQAMETLRAHVRSSDALPYGGDV